VKEAVKAIDRFETELASEARRRGFDGVVCGHIHHAEMREIQGILTTVRFIANDHPING
jgi:UDP-2,3-diacylglucosamine pyrophosphatase LpxH